jgi:hypothetical protein
VAIVDRRTRALLALSAIVVALAVLDLSLVDGVATTLADAGLGSRSALLTLGTMALPAVLLLGWLVAQASPIFVRPASVAPSAPAGQPWPPASRFLLRQQARHHTGTILSLRL